MPAPDAADAEDLEVLREAARAGGALAEEYWHRRPPSWEKPGDAGPVTEADLAVDRLLRERLCAARPDYGWLSEESDASEGREGTPAIFVVDPIDGTRAFIDGQRDWAVALAVVRDGRVRSAVVHVPLRGIVYTASAGGGAQRNGVPIGLGAGPGLAEATVLASRATMTARYWPGGVPPVTRAFRSSLAYRLALVAEGRFDGMMTFRDTWEWDAAAGSLLVDEAGGRATDCRGAALRFNNAHPAVPGLLAAPAGLHGALLARRTAA